METFEAMMQRGGTAAIRQAGRFFMKDDPVHETLRAITQRLTQLNIPHCVAGGMALVAHGYDRTTIDVDILVTEEGLSTLHRELEGFGYIRPFANSKDLRDTTTQVRIEFLVTGQFPGDGKPKPVAFPDPSMACVNMDGINYLRLPALIELKLASGMTGGISRLRDFADVVELVRTLRLPADFASKLNPYVRPKFMEIWEGLQHSEEKT